MAVCARGSVLVFYAAGGFFQLFFLGGGEYMGQAVFQGGAQMITN